MINLDNVSRGLVIQLRRIGDVLLSTPVVRAIKEAKPGIYLAFLTESEAAPILAASPHLDELIVWERQHYGKLGYLWNVIRDIRAKQFDAVIDLQGSSRTALIGLLSGATTRIGFDYRGRSLLYNAKVARSAAPKYGPAFKLDILKPLGIDSTNMLPEFHIPESIRNQLTEGDSKPFRKNTPFTIAISPVSRRWYKRWPLENFAELTKWLIEEFNAQVILLCGPGESEEINWIADEVKHGSVIRAPAQTLFEVAAHLENSDLLISNDNGIKHLATALGISTFTLFGPSEPVSWTYPDPQKHRFIRGACTCEGNNRRRSKCTGPACLTGLSASEVKRSLFPFLRDIHNRKQVGQPPRNLAQA